MRQHSLAAALALLALPVAAQQFDGVYRQAANAECGLVGANGGAVEIAGGIFRGVELECRMENPVDVRDMDAVLYDMTCSGEDDAWSERAMLLRAADGSDDLIMVWNGYVFRYGLCPATP
ncbi:MAG: hypothetical protein ACU0BF_09490 [Paracoccaceae bacterium]